MYGTRYVRGLNGKQVKLLKEIKQAKRENIFLTETETVLSLEWKDMERRY